MLLVVFGCEAGDVNVRDVTSALVGRYDVIAGGARYGDVLSGDSATTSGFSAVPFIGAITDDVDDGATAPNDDVIRRLLIAGEATGVGMCWRNCGAWL